MSWYELLLTLHILAITTWFGSSLAITVIGIRALATGSQAFSSFAVHANWWAGKAHPAAGVVLLLTGFGMLAEADISFGETWVSIAFAGLIVAMGIGGALIGRTADDVVKQIEEKGDLDAEGLGDARRMLLYTRLELAVLVVVIADMVAKPGL